MAAMLPSGQTSGGMPYDIGGSVEPDLIDPDDGTSEHLLLRTRVLPDRHDEMLTAVSPADLDDLDDPLAPPTTDRTPLTGNMHSQSSRSNRGDNAAQSYLTGALGGEDRRAPANTIDETVWETLSRDLLAVWEKMRQVLWPKFLLGGVLVRRGGGLAGDEEERGESGRDRFAGFGSGANQWLGRWPDADDVLQGSLSEGLRDWDLW